jgi:hypothetical protein
LSHESSSVQIGKPALSIRHPDITNSDDLSKFQFFLQRIGTNSGKKGTVSCLKRRCQRRNPTANTFSTIASGNGSRLVTINAVGSAHFSIARLLSVPRIDAGCAMICPLRVKTEVILRGTMRNPQHATLFVLELNS